jgi:hypothetical protein
MYGFRVQDTGSVLHLSITDTVTSRVAAGLYYTYLHGSPNFHFDTGGPAGASRDGHATGLALAIPLGDRFAFGATLKYLHITTDAQNPFYNATTNPTAPQTLELDSTTSGATADGFTFDLGTALRISDALNLAVVGKNLVPLHSVEAPITLGAGLAYHVGNALTLAFDTDVYFDKYHALPPAGAPPGASGARKTTVRLGGGLEWLIAGHVPLRLGSFWDQGLPGTYLSAGLGYVGSSFAIDASFRQKVAGGSEQYLLVGLRVFLE